MVLGDVKYAEALNLVQTFGILWVGEGGGVRTDYGDVDDMFWCLVMGFRGCGHCGGVVMFIWVVGNVVLNICC
jgi:hypothetical protein